MKYWSDQFLSFRFGFNKWRDPMKPTQILARICKDEGLDGPHYNPPGKCRVENMIFAASPTITDEAGLRTSLRATSFKDFCLLMYAGQQHEIQ